MRGRLHWISHLVFSAVKPSTIEVRKLVFTGIYFNLNWWLLNFDSQHFFRFCWCEDLIHLGMNCCSSIFESCESLPLVYHNNCVLTSLMTIKLMPCLILGLVFGRWSEWYSGCLMILVWMLTLLMAELGLLVCCVLHGGSHDCSCDSITMRLVICWKPVNLECDVVSYCVRSLNEILLW